MAEIIKAVQSQEIPNMEIAGVLASNPDAGGIEKAVKLGIPKSDIHVLQRRDFRIPETTKTDWERFGRAITDFFRPRFVSVVTQNGFIPTMPEYVTERYPRSIFNQHPGPPEEFGGKGMKGRAVHAAILEFQRLAGRIFETSVVGHYSHKEVDKGAVVQRAKVPVLAGDTVKDLQERALPVEHRVQIEMLQNFMLGKLRALEPEMLVHPDELPLLEQAKAFAIKEYPDG